MELTGNTVMKYSERSPYLQNSSDPLETYKFLHSSSCRLRVVLSLLEKVIGKVYREGEAQGPL